MDIKISELAERLGAKLTGEGSGVVSSVGTITDSREDQVSFLFDIGRSKQLVDCKAAAVILPSQTGDFVGSQLIVDNVEKALIEALGIFAPELKQHEPGIDTTAKISASAKIGERVYVGPNVVIEDDVVIGDDCIIESGCRIAQRSCLGNKCHIHSNVVIYHSCQIRSNVQIKANSTIGSRGFGYYFIDGAHRQIPHNGGVIIEDFVDIGANCCVDRAKFGNTVIGAGTKIDNQVQIAHNVQIGKCCLLAGQVGIAGSVRIGNGVILGGGTGVIDNVIVGDGVMAGACTLIIKNCEPGAKLLGNPGVDMRRKMRLITLVEKLPELFKQFKKFQARVKELEAAKDDKNRK